MMGQVGDNVKQSCDEANEQRVAYLENAEANVNQQAYARI